jgi:hypothetical protein
MKINLILPTYNNSEATIKCLESIKKYSDPEYEVNLIWIDNNSNFIDRKNVFDFLNKNEIKFDNIFLSSNIGFTEAINIALKFALERYPRNKFIGLIDNESEVSEYWLKNLVLSFSKDEKIACAGLTCDKEMNDKSIIFDINDFTTFNEPLVQYHVVLFKSSVFNEVGFLNNNFDIEFNYRLCRAGYKISKVFNSLNACTSKPIQEHDKLQLEISKKLNENKEKKYVIYTCISGDYDKLKTLTNVNTKIFDYVCFTNTTTIKEDDVFPWKIINVKDIENTLDFGDDYKDKQSKFSRFIKTHPHLFFENYEKSIWIDGNINVIGDVEKYVDLLDEDNYILTNDHPQRNDAYEEIFACDKLKKESLQKLNAINKFLLNENFPRKSGLVQTNVLLRDHNNEQCKFLMEKWWEMIYNYSRRDQLSFNYVFWKHNGKYLSIPWNLIKITYFTTDYKHNQL